MVRWLVGWLGVSLRDQLEKMQQNVFFFNCESENRKCQVADCRIAGRLLGLKPSTPPSFDRQWLVNCRIASSFSWRISNGRLAGCKYQI